MSNPETRQILRAQLQALPKVDLHRHLEGSLRLGTLAEIALEHGLDLPGYDIEELRPLVQVTDRYLDFHAYLRKFELLRRFYPTRQAVERVAYEAVADAAADNVRYLELRFNPVAQARGQGFSLAQVTGWVCGAVQRAQRDHDIEAGLILQIGRDEDLSTAEQIAEVALAHRRNGVVGVDLAGDEINYPCRRFAPVFRRVAQAGLGVTIHAGEAGSADNVREAIEFLGAQRVGHGVRSIESSDIVRLVHQRGVTLEVCPTSNLQTGVVRRFGQHPLPDLLHLGLKVTINTDNPSVSDTTLSDEYMVVMLAMGLNLQEIKQAILTAVDAAFLPEQRRARLRAQMETVLGLA